MEVRALQPNETEYDAKLERRYRRVDKILAIFVILAIVGIIVLCLSLVHFQPVWNIHWHHR